MSISREQLHYVNRNPNLRLPICEHGFISWICWFCPILLPQVHISALALHFGICCSKQDNDRIATILMRRHAKHGPSYRMASASALGTKWYLMRVSSPICSWQQSDSIICMLVVAHRSCCVRVSCLGLLYT